MLALLLRAAAPQMESQEMILPGDVLCKGSKHQTVALPPLPSHTQKRCWGLAKALLLVLHILGKKLLNTSGEVLPHTHTGALAQRQLNTPGCTCSHNYLLWLSPNKRCTEPINLTMASFFSQWRLRQGLMAQQGKRLTFAEIPLSCLSAASP